MKKIYSELIKRRIEKIIKGWHLIRKKTKIKLQQINFFLCLLLFNYPGKKEILNTFTKYMLNEGYLSTNYMFVTYISNEKAINDYLKKCEKVFIKIKKNLENLNNLKARKRKFNY